jgi:hypothetical protein
MPDGSRCICWPIILACCIWAMFGVLLVSLFFN